MLYHLFLTWVMSVVWGRLKKGNQTATEAGGCICHIWSIFSLWSKKGLSTTPTLPSLYVGRLNQHPWRSCQKAEGAQGAAAHQQLRGWQLQQGRRAADTNVGTLKSPNSPLKAVGDAVFSLGLNMQKKEQNQRESQGRDKHFRAVHVRTTLENSSIPYKPGAKKGSTETW